MYSVKSLAYEIVSDMLRKEPYKYLMKKLMDYDDNTYLHSLNVAYKSTQIALLMYFDGNLSKFEVDQIAAGSLLHDIGKIMISADIIRKPERLSDFEYLLITEHSQKGYDLLKRMNYKEDICKIVLQHHERYGGQGYPGKLTNKETCIGARIVQITDCIDAIMQQRCYKPAGSLKDALAVICKGSGILFDPQIVKYILKTYIHPEIVEEEIHNYVEKKDIQNERLVSH